MAVRCGSMAQAKNSVRMSVDMPQDIYDELVKFAKKERSSKSRIIIIATAFYIRFAADQMAFGRTPDVTEKILNAAHKAKQEKEKMKLESPEENPKS